MAEETGIAWTDSTFNPWRGCMKVSEGCKNCYAEQLVTKRQGLPVWGQDARRIVAAESTWKNPIRWNKQAGKDGRKQKVFCASLADIFERYEGPAMDAVWAARARLFVLVKDTPNLIWQVLTKRPENIMDMVPQSWRDSWPRNVWIGCTVENQKRAADRLPHLLRVPAAVRFVSYEPALEPVDFARIEVVKPEPPNGPGVWLNALTGHVIGPDDILPHHVDWLIIGGESGPGARPFNPVWADWTVTQCKAAGVPVFVKQMGSNPTFRGGSGWGPIRDSKGGDWSEWPAQLRVREFPNH
jgi:protein gp37